MKKLLLIVFFIFLVGCQGSKPKEIKTDDIFNQKGSYYVYFYQESCPACIQTSAKLKERVKEGKMTCYFLNVSSNQINITSDENHSNVGVSLVKDLKVRVTPELIYIEGGVVMKHYVGGQSIMNHLK